MNTCSTCEAHVCLSKNKAVAGDLIFYIKAMLHRCCCCCCTGCWKSIPSPRVGTHARLFDIRPTARQQIIIIIFLPCVFSRWSQSKAQVFIATPWMTSPTENRAFPWCQLTWVSSAWCAKASWPFSCCPQTPAQVGLSEAPKLSLSFSTKGLSSNSQHCNWKINQGLFNMFSNRSPNDIIHFSWLPVFLFELVLFNLGDTSQNHPVPPVQC